MNTLPVQPGSDQPEPCAAQHTGNMSPVLREILQALRELAADGREGAIDLRSLPFGPGDERALKDALGIGEVSALVQALGESEVEETAYPGVWWVEHRGPDGAVIAKTVEIAFVPKVLRSQTDDVKEAVARLDAALHAESSQASEG